MLTVFYHYLIKGGVIRFFISWPFLTAYYVTKSRTIQWIVPRLFRMQRSFILLNIWLYSRTSYALVYHRNRGEEGFRVYLEIVKIAQAQRYLLWSWVMKWYEHRMLTTLKIKKIYSALLLVEKTIKHGETIHRWFEETYIHHQCERYYRSLSYYTFPFLVIHEPAYASQRPEVPGGEG